MIAYYFVLAYVMSDGYVLDTRSFTSAEACWEAKDRHEQTEKDKKKPTIWVCKVYPGSGE